MDSLPTELWRSPGDMVGVAMLLSFCVPPPKGVYVCKREFQVSSAELKDVVVRGLLLGRSYCGECCVSYVSSLVVFKGQGNDIRRTCHHACVGWLLPKWLTWDYHWHVDR